MSKLTVLIILDGFGYSPQKKYNAIKLASTPFLDNLFSQFGHTTLQAAGSTVGLLDGDIGNSEVGHLTIGSGRVITQPVKKLHDAIDNSTLFSHPVLLKILKQVKKNGTKLHIMGLLSDASVHSHEKHLYAFLDIANQHNIDQIFVHPFLDGRDVPPQSAELYLNRLEQKLKTIPNTHIGSIHGRFYAMDRDNNWDRTEKSYRILTEKQPKVAANWRSVLQQSYAQNITDEFIPPTQLDQKSIITENDGILFFNFRPDRARQLTACFTDPDFKHFAKKDTHLSGFITPTSYNNAINTEILLDRTQINNTLKEVLSKAQKTIFCIAETEKYAHVTYFFAGGREAPFSNETQLLIPSIRTKNYVDLPCMSAQKITDAVLDSLKKKPCDFYLINYANADMVAHSGNLAATIEAIECLDAHIKQLYEVIIKKMHGTLYITADHGNAEDMFDEKIGQPRTAHTNNPVPFIMVTPEIPENKSLPLKQLSDIAPFILKNMGLPIPDEMK